MSKIEWPKFERPELDMPNLEQITGFYRDAAYVGIGLAVVTVERLQALQRQLLELLKAQLAKVREAV